MFDFLEWYFPWSHLDPVLKTELVLWLAALGAAFLIPIWTLVLGKPWLPLSHLPGPSSRDDEKEEGP